MMMRQPVDSPANAGTKASASDTPTEIATTNRTRTDALKAGITIATNNAKIRIPVADRIAGGSPRPT